MGRLYRTAAVFLAAALLSALLLSGCSDSGTIKEDAENYVTAVLDLMCTGDYDHSVTFADAGSEKEPVSRDDMIAEIVGGAAKDNDLNEEQCSQLKDLITRAFASCRYSVKNVKETDDGGCDVTVSIEPLKLFEGVSDALSQKAGELSADTENAITMTSEEQTAALAQVLFAQLNQNLEKPQYDPSVEIVVHYGLLEGSEDRYGIDENAGKALGEKLFSREGL